MKLLVQLAWTYATTLVYFACISKSSPQVVLTADPPWSEMFPGDTVILTCHITGPEESLEGWNFTWSRITQKNSTSEIINVTTGEVGPVHILSPVREADQGQYQCIGQKESEHFYSNPHELIVSGDRPQAVLTQDPPFPVLFTGENVTLKCEIRKGSQWRYSWGKKNRQKSLEKLTSEYDDGHQAYTLQSVTVRDSGQYLCHAEYMNNPVIQPYSGSLFLKVLEKKPKTIIKKSAGEIYTGERLTLTCTVDGGSTGWKYLWYKDTQGAVLSNTDSNRTDGSSYTISSAAPSHSGQYWCRAHRGGFYSNYSDSHKVNIQVVPQSVLSLQSGWTNMFPTETVTLRCDVQGNSTPWVYKWYRDGQEIPMSGDGDTYTILSATQSHPGQYQCRGELPDRAVTSLESNSLNLTLYETPRPLISTETEIEEIYTGERLTLTCTVDGGSTGLKYLWYKDTQGAVLSNTDSNRTDGSSYTISSAAPSHSGQYWCRAHRGGFYSNYSDSHKVNIQVLPQAVLSLDTAWTQILTTVSLTLRCEIQGNFSGWNYTWYSDGLQLPPEHNGETFNVTFSNAFYQTEYRCTGNRTEKPFYSVISNGLVTRKYVINLIGGLSGSVLFVITLVVLFAVSKKLCRKSAGKKRNKMSEKFYMVNMDYISADDIEPSTAIYEEIEEGIESRGTAPVSFYSNLHPKH